MKIMKAQLINFIAKADWQGVLNYLNPLPSEERNILYNYLKAFDINRDLLGKDGFDLEGKKREAFFDNRKRISSCLEIATLACTQNAEEMLTFGTSPKDQVFRHLSSPSMGYEPIITFFKKFPPTYLDAAIKKIAKEQFSRIDFQLLWNLHENGWVTFDEEIFVRSLFIVHMFDRSTVSDANFLMENPKAFEKVFLQFYKYELPVLDISKWHGKVDYQCAKVNTFWTEVIQIFLENDVKIPRKLISNLLESLLNNWKKPHLNWHISLIILLSPTKVEYLKHQNLFFAFFNSDNLRILNFTVETIKSIHTEKGFNHKAFVESAPTLFIREKVDKTLTRLLPLFTYSLDNNPELQRHISEQLSLGLLQVNTLTQAKFATLIVKYTPKEALNECIEPYVSVLKIKALEILGVEKNDADVEETPIENEVLTSVTPPNNWDDLLFHIGTCITTKTACDIDLFFEGLLALQDVIPEDYQKQLKPYLRQLNKRHWEIEVMLYFKEFINNWSSSNKKYFEAVTLDRNHIPFLRHKGILTFNRLQKKNTLPFLSTPTHLPFYVHPDNLVAKLVQYEEQKQAPDLEDLIVAINRIIKENPSNETVEKAKNLKGDYRLAIQFLLGISDTVQLEKKLFSSNAKLLPLWSQVCRTKNPDKQYDEFSKSKVASIPTVIKPYHTGFKIVVQTSGSWTWYRLKLDANWNNGRWYVDDKDKPQKHPSLHYYAAPHGLASREDIIYQITMLPNYVDAWLCRYLPDTASNNEVAEFEQCQYPLQALLDNKLKVYHSGWLYIAQCLIFEKKISRELAAEYISYSIKNGCIAQEVIAKALGVMLSEKYAPVKRLTDYIEKPGHSKRVKELQHSILIQCILEATAGKLPNSFKKIITLHQELSKELKIKENRLVVEKLNTLKK